MSLNELYYNAYKPWLNVNVGSVKVDGNLFIPNIVGTPGQYLGIVAGIAKWEDIPGVTYNNEFGAYITGASSIPTGISTLVLGQEIVPFNLSVFSFTTGNNYVEVLMAGRYQIFSKVSLNNVNTGISISVFIDSGSGYLEDKYSQGASMPGGYSSQQYVAASSFHTIALTANSKIQFRVYSPINNKVNDGTNTIGIIYLGA